MALERIMALIRKIGGKEEDEHYEPKPVIDRPLDSLRRQRQTQVNEVEREQLKKKIMAYQKDQERKHLWGLKNKIEKKKELLNAIKKKKVTIMHQKKILATGSLLDNRKDEFKKTNVLKNHSRFI